MRRILSGAAVASLAAGLLVFGAPTAANACSTSPVTPSIVAGNEIRWGATSYCSLGGGVGNGDLIAFLYHYYAPPIPDVSPWYVIDTTGPSFSAFASECDNGGTTTYYTRSHQANTAGPWSNSPLITLNHC